MLVVFTSYRDLSINPAYLRTKISIVQHEDMYYVGSHSKF
jgi:hypothetical protein